MKTAVLTAMLMAASVSIQVVRDARWQPFAPETALLWTQSGPLMNRLTLGFNNLAADVYWMRAVIYYGGTRLQKTGTKNYDLLAPLLNLVTSLDPRFRIAYRFGAIFLTEAYPNGPGVPQEAISLLRHGIERDAPRWEYMHDIAFVYYWWLRDYKQAAEWFERASQAEHAPEWLKPLAANTLAVGGDRRASRLLWQQMRESADQDWIRTSAELRLQQLDALDAIDQLNAFADRFAARVGRPPASWAELVAAERLRGIPLDDAGVPFVLDAGTGRVTISGESPLWPLPQEPTAQATGRLR
jgi:hypothetical protein